MLHDVFFLYLKLADPYQSKIVFFAVYQTDPNDLLE